MAVSPPPTRPASTEPFSRGLPATVNYPAGTSRPSLSPDLHPAGLLAGRCLREAMPIE